MRHMLKDVCLSVLLFSCAFITFTQLNSDWPARATILAGLAVIAALVIWASLSQKYPLCPHAHQYLQCIQMGWGSSLSSDFFRFRTTGRLSAARTRRAAAQLLTVLAGLRDATLRFTNRASLNELLSMSRGRTGDHTKAGEATA